MSTPRSQDPPPPPLSHVDERGAARMVDVTQKQETARYARAAGRVLMLPETLARILAGDLEKGEVLPVVRLAAIQAVKRTADLIPLCHPLRVTAVRIELTPDVAAGALSIQAEVEAFDRTGVEMEALCAVSVAALTLYDMCKAIDRGMRITDVRLMEKRGGRSGPFRADGEFDPA